MSPRDGFFVSASDEPHAARRKEIIAKHPEIAHLFVPDARPVPVVIAIISSQLAIAYLQQAYNWPWWVLLAVAWIYGGLANHALSLMTHEVSHGLVFRSVSANDYFGILCNVAMAFPSSTMFKRYHMEHHQFQGDRDMDMDLPTVFEGEHVTSVLSKTAWVFLMPLIYGARPQHVRPKTHRFIDNVNICIIVCTNAIIYTTCGPRGLLYLVLSTVLGMGIHPIAGHFIAEHFVFVKDYETYSYYGLLNLASWNVGYHNEHHDFPRVPGWKLPLVKAMAPEFYEHLPSHASWTGVIWKFITNPDITPFSRVVRKHSKK